MTIHVEQVDITAQGVVVSGQVSASNISVTIVARTYFQAPEDGIWEYDLIETQRGGIGLTVMRPFTVKAAFPSFDDAKGVRILLPRGDGSTAAITQLMPAR